MEWAAAHYTNNYNLLIPVDKLHINDVSLNRKTERDNNVRSLGNKATVDNSA